MQENHSVFSSSVVGVQFDLVVKVRVERQLWLSEAKFCLILSDRVRTMHFP